MADNYKLLTRLLVGVLKHQAKRYLGEDVITALVEAGTEHLGERLLDILKGEASTSEQAKKLSVAIKSAAEELERALGDEAYLHIEDTQVEIVEAVVEALANLESGDLFGRRLQSAIQDLVASSVGEIDADNSLRISMQLYQAVLMAVLTIPELQPRAQDLLLQSRIWLLGEQIRKIELMNRFRDQAAIPTATVKAVPSVPCEKATKELRSGQFGEGVADKEGRIEAGHVVANGTVELVKLIGQGGQASVWQGRLNATGDHVAVRFLNEDLIEKPEIVHSFKREVDIIQALSGDAIPNLVQSIMFEEGRYFYIVDYVEETISLTQVIQSSDVPVAKKIRLISDSAGVLHTIHQQGFIHGDVKPENITIVGHDRGVRLIDFGSARRIGTRDAYEPITFTYAYAAPELLALHQTMTKESQTSRSKVYIAEVGPYLDIYPLGVILFQVIDPGLSRIARMEEYGFIDQLLVSRDLKAVIRKAMARKPTDRFKSVLEFKLALEEAVRSGST
ncbi:hypothetical protein D1BOALGB6SA_4896 [Olavius sp. associated proteobacterium Delta 1]|nr:hypothetical protein D1BOALGB6SA_4896 [Olavius sp. associated proteobacterium Delta 1]